MIRLTKFIKDLFGDFFDTSHVRNTEMGIIRNIQSSDKGLILTLHNKQKIYVSHWSDLTKGTKTGQMLIKEYGTGVHYGKD